MKWAKKGLIYVADGRFSWAKSHAMIPTPDIINDDTLRIYVTFCDEQGIGRVGYVEVDAYNPAHIVALSSEPVRA